MAPRVQIEVVSRALVALLCCAVCLVNSTVKCEYDQEKFKQIVTSDTANDDAVDLTAVQLIQRSGFKSEQYYAIADDGYITQIVRVINPKADATKLRPVPVMMMHGVHVDITSYLVASSIQHHPEPWPRTQSDGLMTSSNRSLAFTLANNGFDVYLVGSRGSNHANQAFTKFPRMAQRVGLRYKPGPSTFERVNNERYWNYGMDDIIEYDIGRQIDVVRKVSGKKEVVLFTFSLSCATSLAFLAQNEDYARNVVAYVQMGPAVVASQGDDLSKFLWQHLVPALPTKGIGFLPTFFTERISAQQVMKLAQESMETRYSLVSAFIQQLFGPSPKYLTNLELNLLAHIFQPASFKSLQQFGQQSAVQKLTKFNYGPVNNMQAYNQTQPPAYDIGRIEVQNWLVISSPTDGFSNPETIERLVQSTSAPKPPEQIVVSEKFSHLDLFAALEVDKYVNLPVVEYLSKLV